MRDVTYGEDRSAIRTGAAPQAMVHCRNLTLALLRWIATSDIAAASRTYAGRLGTAIAIVATAGPATMK